MSILKVVRAGRYQHRNRVEEVRGSGNGEGER